MTSGATTQLIASELFGIRLHDPLSHAVAAILVVAAAMAALSVPAGRATRVDPVLVLRD